MEIPFLANGLLHQSSIQTGRIAIDFIEGAHYAATITFLHAHLKRPKECLYHILLMHLCTHLLNKFKTEFIIDDGNTRVKFKS